jgi:hypothetical protein
MAICAEGHASAAQDYCDVCGAQIRNAPEEPQASSRKACSACGTLVAGRFCETCGQDSALPEAVTAVPPASSPRQVEWTAVVCADREYYERILANGGPDTVDFPQFFPERRIVLKSETTLIGRRNRGQGVEPDIDLGIHPGDRGVSTQHAVLRLRSSGPTITDLGSTNGTSLNGSDELLRNGEEIPLADGDRIHVGAWTTIAIRRGQVRNGEL